MRPNRDPDCSPYGSGTRMRWRDPVVLYGAALSRLPDSGCWNPDVCRWPSAVGLGTTLALHLAVTAERLRCARRMPLDTLPRQSDLAAGHSREHRRQVQFPGRELLLLSVVEAQPVIEVEPPESGAGQPRGHCKAPRPSAPGSDLRSDSYETSEPRVRRSRRPARLVAQPEHWTARRRVGVSRIASARLRGRFGRRRQPRRTAHASAYQDRRPCRVSSLRMNRWHWHQIATGLTIGLHRGDSFALRGREIARPRGEQEPLAKLSSRSRPPTHSGAAPRLPNQRRSSLHGG